MSSFVQREVHCVEQDARAIPADMTPRPKPKGGSEAARKEWGDMKRLDTVYAAAELLTCQTIERLFLPASYICLLRGNHSSSLCSRMVMSKAHLLALVRKDYNSSLVWPIHYGLKTMLAIGIIRHQTAAFQIQV
jgi:hypothetical protein